MSARLLLLCPGQGGQHGAMYELARTDAGAAAMLDACGLSSADAATMFDNRVAQPAIVGATLAMWEALRQRVMPPDLVTGYSVGELSAYGVAGAFDPAAAVSLAATRARLMSGAVTEAQALVAIGGVPLEPARALVAAADFDVAIITGLDTCIAGGREATLAPLEQAVGAAGGRLQRLPVGIASHTALMATAVAPFAAALLATPFHRPACPVLSGIGAEAITGHARAVETLSRQLSETIVWSDCMDAAAEAGMTVALELGPGAALARMLQARHPHIACRSVADFRSLDGIVAWLERQAG
ncbi:ACP S-malonyltransferase [Massilia sp. TWR1-2-2]|uniref:ACP S-malonyltransferase n=1 Tax=Massilia sp. TWR1-2-2 TaxID=2804584 RepID=UPI003CF2C4F3